MGLIQAEVSMSQPTNVVYTHKKFKRTSSSQPWDASDPSLPDVAVSADDSTASPRRHLADRRPTVADTSGADTLLLAASLVAQCSASGAAAAVPRCNGAWDNGFSHRKMRAVQCSYCSYTCDDDDDLQRHVSGHLLPLQHLDVTCTACFLPDALCSCPHGLVSQHDVGLSEHTSPQRVTSHDEDYSQPADLSTKSTNKFNICNYSVASSPENQILYSKEISKTIPSRAIYKPKFRASYSLDESSLPESTAPEISSASVSNAIICSTTCSDAMRRAANPTYHTASSLTSPSLASSSKRSTSANMASYALTSNTPLSKFDAGITFTRLSNIVGSSLWKNIKSPSPDIGEHIDKIIVQNQVIMDSDNPLWTRKYRRQSSIGSSSTEGEGSSAPRNRRYSVSDPAKCRLAACLPTSHQSRQVSRLPSDLSEQPYGLAKRGQVSSVQPQAPLHTAPVEGELKRSLSVEGSVEQDLLRQHFLTMPDSETNKILLARGHLLALQGTSIVPVTNTAAMLLVCHNCSASFKNRESLEIHMERHCDVGVRNYTYNVTVHDRGRVTKVVTKSDHEQEVALNLQKRENMSDGLHSMGGLSLGVDAHLNSTEQPERFSKNLPMLTRQHSLERSVHPHKKRKLSCDIINEDLLAKSVQPVFIHNGVIFQKANVPLKIVEETRKPSRHQLCGGEVKICDGTEYKTMKIDTNECNRNLALDMCISSDSSCPNPASPVPTSRVVTLSKSGLNCGGTVVESHTGSFSKATTNLVTSRSSCHRSADETVTRVHAPETVPKLIPKENDNDISSLSLSALQQYAPQLQLPNLSIPGVPIPNISGAVLPKLAYRQSDTEPKRILSLNETRMTSKFNFDSNLNSPSREVASDKSKFNPEVISIGKERVPYVPGIPGPYSQASSDVSPVPVPATKRSSSPVLKSDSGASAISPKYSIKANTFELIQDKQIALNGQSEATAVTFSKLSHPLDSNIISKHQNPIRFSPTKHTKVVSKPTSRSLALEGDVTAAKTEPVSMSDTTKEGFLMPRRRPDTLPLKPQLFVPKSSALMIGSTIMSPDTPRPKKSCAQLLLDGSAYTYLGLKVSTKTFYCCIYRPQPMYVLQSPDSKISMYSIWQIRKSTEDNPLNLSISECMGLYASRSYTDKAYTVAKPKVASFIYTYSDEKMIRSISFLSNEDRMKFETSLPPCVPSHLTGKAAIGKATPPANWEVHRHEGCEIRCTAKSHRSVDDSAESSSSSSCGSDQLQGSSGRHRIKIFDGGFRSTEDYTYVRGRGRGRYVCSTCGIRCKKPSMLKKHIRTHTNLRPYPCSHCSSSFKTKGNLTKHLKSKAHFKRCLVLGVAAEQPASGHDDTSGDMEYDGQNDDDDGDEDDEDDPDDDDDDDEDDDCDDDLSREQSLLQDSSRESSRVRDSRENSHTIESRENSCIRDSRENSHTLESRENSCFRDSRENSHTLESRENSCFRDSRENSHLIESRENSCIRDSENSHLIESRENSCVRDSRGNSCVRDSRGNSCVRDSRGNSYVRDSRESSYVRESRENSYVRESREDSYVRESREDSYVRESRENSYVREGTENSFIKDIHGDSCTLDSRENSCVGDSRENSCTRDRRQHDAVYTGCNSRENSVDEVAVAVVDGLTKCEQAGVERRGLMRAIVDHVEGPTDLSCKRRERYSLSPLLLAADNNAPIDLTVKKQHSSLLPYPTTVHGNSVLRSSFLPIFSPSSCTSVPSSLLLKSPLTPIKEQPADILSPLTDSSMMLKSIYNTTERATKASTAFSVLGEQSHTTRGMSVYLTERAIQETFIKLHQYQATTPVRHTPSVTEESLDVESYHTGTTVPRTTVAQLSTACSLVESSYASGKEYKNHTQSSTKVKSYYCNKWHGAKPASSLLFSSEYSQSNQGLHSKAKLTSNIDFDVPVLSVSLALSVNTTESRCSFSKVDSAVTITEHVSNVHENIISVGDSQSNNIISGMALLQKIATSVQDKSNYGGVSSYVTAVNSPVSTSVSTTAPAAMATQTISVNNAAGHTQAIPKMTLIKTSAGTIIAVTSGPTQDSHSKDTSMTTSSLGNRNTLTSVTTDLQVHAPVNVDVMQSTAATSVFTLGNATVGSKDVSYTTPALNVQCVPTSSLLTQSSTVMKATQQISSTANQPSADVPSLPETAAISDFSDVQNSHGGSGGKPSVPSSEASSVSQPLSQSGTHTTVVVSLVSSGLTASSSRAPVSNASPSSAVNLTVLNSSTSKTGASFLSPSGVVPTSASSRSATEDGRCRCHVCHKEFGKWSQLSLHMNIHYMERPYRCVACAVSFRTNGHLQKHKRSASHFNKMSMNLTFGAASTENPRPFKCHDCKIAFRIHGHLAKHLRSKMHILKLECLGKLPFGVYAEMERTGSTLANIDTTDCENSLLSLQALASKLFAKEPSKLLAWQKGDGELSASEEELSRQRTISNSSTNSDDYSLGDDQDDPPLADSGDEHEGYPTAAVTPPLQRSFSSSPLVASNSPGVVTNRSTHKKIDASARAKVVTCPTVPSSSPDTLLANSGVPGLASPVVSSPPRGTPSTTVPSAVPAPSSVGGTASVMPASLTCTRVPLGTTVMRLTADALTQLSVSSVPSNGKQQQKATEQQR